MNSNIKKIEQFRDRIFIISSLKFLGFSLNTINEYSSLRLNKNTFKKYMIIEKDLINEVINENISFLEEIKKNINSKSISFVMNELNKINLIYQIDLSNKKDENQDENQDENLTDQEKIKKLLDSKKQKNSKKDLSKFI